MRHLCVAPRVRPCPASTGVAGLRTNAEVSTVATILVIEDEPEIREAVVELLAREGFATDEAENGSEALKLLREHSIRPDLIVLDLMMPVMDGWTFRRAQLADPELAAIPVVVMSAVDTGDIEASATVQKPFAVEELVGAVAGASRAPPRGATAPA
jgi:two-component system, chemotaxis family, chemotaxis protein CheY